MKTTNYINKSKLPGFAFPNNKTDDMLIKQIVAYHSQKIISQFLEIFGKEIEESSEGLISIISNWEYNYVPFDAVWNKAIGNIYRDLSRGSTKFLTNAAMLALQLNACGVSGNWELKLNSPSKLRWQNKLLPETNKIRVYSKAKTTIISINNSGKALHFDTSKEDFEDNVTLLQQIIFHMGSMLLFSADSIDDYDPDIFNMVYQKEYTERIIIKVKTAMRLIELYSPNYFDWVIRVLRYIVPLKNSGKSIISGSSSGKPGEVFVTISNKKVEIAEMLIHEATHQYLHILNRIGKLDDGSDKTLYFSPIKQTGRPIGAILVAYHAFANVLLFYRSCIENRLEDGGYCRINHDLLLPQLLQLEDALRSSPSLTELGNGLWQPLSELI